MRYLTITYLRQPGGQIDEQVGFTKRLKTTDIQTCNVIIDYLNKKVEKCVIEGKIVERTFDQLNDYYKQVYPSLIENLERVNRAEPKGQE